MARARLGGFDILVNNAGIMQEVPLGEVTRRSHRPHFAVNVRGADPRDAGGAAAPSPTAAGSSTSPRSLPISAGGGASVYCATKAALLGLTRSWARELAPRILVNAVAPGPTDTPLLGFDALTESQRALETAHPLGRIGRPEEIAAAIVFLAGPGATFFTGQCLGANGGAAML